MAQLGETACCRQPRMLNNDVIQVYNRIKVGTPVVVTNN
jgi:hypothetical protein